MKEGKMKPKPKFQIRRHVKGRSEERTCSSKTISYLTDKKINFQRTYLPIIPLFSNPPFINELSQSALLVHPVCERLESDKTG